MNQRNDFTLRLLKSYLKPNMKVLDIGCGKGEVSFLTSDLVCKNSVGEKGQVIGVDIDEKSLNLSNQIAQDQGLDKHVHFIQQDISALDFEGVRKIE